MVRCGAFFSALLTNRGRVYTWGTSEYGALGLGSKSTVALTPSLVTSRILERRRFVDLALGDEHCAAVTSMGNCYAWGQGCFGAVGKPAADRFSHPPNVKRPLKLPLPQACRVRSVSCGGNYTAICAVDGGVWVLGDDDPSLRPLLLGGPPPPPRDLYDMMRTVPTPKDLAPAPPAPAGPGGGAPAHQAQDTTQKGGGARAYPQLRARAVVCGRFHTMAVMDAAQAAVATDHGAAGTAVSRFFMCVPFPWLSPYLPPSLAAPFASLSPMCVCLCLCLCVCVRVCV